MSVRGAGVSGSKTSSQVRLVVDEVSREAIARRLSVGSTLTARVLESHGQGRYTVGFAGLRIIAESSVPLTPGMRLAVTVAGLDPKIHLRILEPDAASTGRLLRELGIEAPNAEAESLLERLRERGLPIDRTSFMKMLRAVRQGLTPDQAARLVEWNLPFSPGVLDRLRASDGDLGAALTRLAEALKRAGRESEAAAVTKALTFDGDLKRLFEEHPLRLERRLLAGEARPDDPAALLRRLATAGESALPIEKEIAGEARHLLDILEGRYLAGEPEAQIPFLVEEDGTHEAWIAANRSPGRATIRFRLGTSRLGEVKGVVDFVGRVAGMTLGASTREARTALAQNAPRLKESLDALGFRIESLGVEMTPQGDSQGDGGAAVVLSPVGLDIKA